MVTKIMIAPTERSMPAVRTIIVCPTANAPMMATCCRMSERLAGSRNRSLINQKLITDPSSTTVGLMPGCRWRSLLNRWTRVRGRARYLSAAVCSIVSVTTACLPLALACYQHRAAPSSVSMLSSPSTASSVTSAVPVLTKSEPASGSGSVPSSSHWTTASIPRRPISLGYC